jgi:hypothetical protein
VIAKCKREWVEARKMERQELFPRSSRRQLLANAAIVDAKPADLPVQAAQIGCKIGQSVVSVLRPAILDHDILALHVAGFANALPECGRSASAELLRNPITGIAGCCARPASGHAAPPPSSAMNSRRFH